MSIYKTAESVSPKHPDKICDQISDAVLDAHLKEDPYARIAIDVAGGHGSVFVTGEVTSKAKNVDVKAIVRRLAGDVTVIENIDKQSPEIAQGVNDGGAGDQGIMVGYATDETVELLPIEVVLSRQLNQYIFNLYPYDGKTQITLIDGVVHSIVVSFQNTTQSQLTKLVEKWLHVNGIPTVTDVSYHLNPAGDWIRGGFDADAGLTGRKLIVDNYGPRIPIGGGAFSGKEVYVYLAYAIGYNQPLEATVVADGIPELVTGYDLSPLGIIKYLNLRLPIYEKTARYGHFGHSGLSWDI
jgi:S-adenosylmethionine synthetase